MNLPPNMRAIILKFGLTDINVRSNYNFLKVYQKGCKENEQVDLTNYFYIGAQQLPPFGQVTELIMPWDDDKEQVLCVDFEVSQAHGYAMQSGAKFDNPYEYATFAIAGYQYKQ